MTNVVASLSEPGEGQQVAPRLFAASYAQERVWFASQVSQEVSLYHIADELRLPYPLPFARMRAALAQVCQRHEPLRTAFRVDAGELMQVVHPRAARPLPVTEVDLTHEPEESLRQRVNDLADEMSTRPFPLDEAPLWRGTFVRCPGGEWRLLFVAHHTVVDAASEFNLRAELNEICAAELDGRPPELPDLPTSYTDYATWQREQLATRSDELIAFWATTLADLPAVHGVRTDRSRPAERDFAGADLIFTLPDDVLAAVPELARGAKATPFMVMLAAYVALIHRISGDRDIVIGLPVAGRDRAELRPLIGMFVNMIPVRVDASGDPTFTDLLGRVRSVLFAAWDHQEMPFQKLVEEFGTRREPGLPPLYQLAFNYLDIGFGARAASAEDDLMLEISNGEGRFEYSTALFDAATIRGFADAYLSVLRDLVLQPSTPLSALTVQPTTAGLASTMPAVDTGSAETTSDTPAPYLAPRSAAEELVASVWAEVLGRDRVGALDDFFELGGHSLLALRVIARLCAAAEVELSIQAFFADTTVAGVAAAFEALLTAELDALDEDEARRLAEEGSSS